MISFLGYDPIPEPMTLPDRIQWARRRNGISQGELARRLGLDPATVWAWEAETVVKPFPRIAAILEE